jgi:hypothetical protein
MPHKKRGSKAKLEGRLIIINVSDEGMLLAPHDNVIMTNHIGALVRDNIPISFWYWKGPEVVSELHN